MATVNHSFTAPEVAEFTCSPGALSRMDALILAVEEPGHFSSIKSRICAARSSAFLSAISAQNSVPMFGLHSLSSSSRRGCNLRAVKITVASKMACFRSSVMESPQFRIEMRQRQEKGFYTLLVDCNRSGAYNPHRYALCLLGRQMRRLRHSAKRNSKISL